ncbi:MAG: FAD-dependent oxidoreductase [Betaproteobacteria bacterium]
MLRITELKLPLTALPVDARRAADAPSETDEDRRPTAHPLPALTRMAAQALGVAVADIQSLHVFKRSFDARKADLLAVFIVDVALDAATEQRLLAQFAEHPHIGATPDMAYHPVRQAPATLPLRPVVVGFGPCGMFAALLLAQMGFKPIVLERGPAVRQRTKDTWDLWRKHTLHPESNVQFGEGGAGTFSDGKLWSQIKDPRHLGRKVMQEFVEAGAPPDILVEAHPHIGTFKLVKVVENLRARIMALGGEVRFGQRVTDIRTTTDATPEGDVRRISGLQVLDLASGALQELAADHVVMALGHSARDTFAMLWAQGVAMQAKPFSVGFRIEHPQGVIDRARWGRHAGHPLLGAADYKLVHHAKNGRSVYSFCMCPGGTVVAATSEPERVVTNGMSQYSRNERNANAGIVVGIDPADYPHDEASFVAAFGAADGARYAAEARVLLDGQAPSASRAHPMAGIAMQRKLESAAYVHGGASYDAPSQLVGDFLAARASTSLGTVLPSYQPGVKLVDLASSLPAYAIEAIRESLPVFGRKIKGFDMADAVLTGVETRTSSPLKLPRGEDLQSTNLRGLYPAGEGASYAGGILSAGVDGIKVAEALAMDLLP